MDSPNQTISTTELFEAILHRKRAVVVSVAIILTSILFYNHFATPIYEATATVVVENYSDDTIVGSELTSSLSRESALANRIQEMRTFTFARQVFEALADPMRNLIVLPDPLSQIDPHDYKIGIIGSNLSARQIAKTDFISVMYVSNSPELAAAVANCAAELLQGNDLKIRRQSYANLKRFIDTQISVVSEKLQQAEQELSDYKEETKIISIEAESKEILQRITQVEIVLNRVKSDLYATQKQLSMINKRLDEQKQKLSQDVLQISDGLTARLKETLIELNVRYSDLEMQGLAENHPKMVEVRHHIEQTKQMIIQTTMQLLEGEAIDPLSRLRANAEESIRLEVQVQSLTAQRNNLHSTLQQYNNRIKNFPAYERRLGRLLRDREINNQIFVRLLEEREQARIREAAEIGNIRIVEAAQIPLKPTRPRKMMNLAIGLFLGLTIGFIWIFASEFMRDVPKTEEEVENILNLPVLASVPNIKHGLSFPRNGKHRQLHLVSNNAVSPLLRDAFSYLWSSIDSALPNSSSIVMITSACPAEGKSTVAANLAIIAAQHGKKTILIDGDLRRPVLHELVSVQEALGLTNLLIKMNGPATPSSDELVTSEANGDEAQRSDAYQRLPEPHTRQDLQDFLDQALQQSSSLETLQVLAAGSHLTDPSILWSSQAVKEMLTLLKQTADVIIIDTPPILGIPDASFIARHVDYVLLCIEAAKTEKGLLKRAQKILTSVGTNFLGVVLNKVEPASIYGGYKHYKYYEKHYQRGV